MGKTINVYDSLGRKREEIKIIDDTDIIEYHGMIYEIEPDLFDMYGFCIVISAM